MTYKGKYVKEVYKIIHCIAKVNQELLFTKSHNAAFRDNSMKLSNSKYKAKKRKTGCFPHKILLHHITFCYMQL